MRTVHNTKSAAAFLGVSEASIRRWSDAGLLPVQRVGRRGNRRFEEADLRRFAASQPAAPAAAVSEHEHLATFYASDGGRMRASLPFLRAGLAGGDTCFLVAPAGLARDYVEALPAGGQLVIRPTVGSSPREAVAAWEELWVEALNTGARAIRVVGEMATYEGLSSVGEMLDYEVAYDSLSRRFPVSTICQYDVRHFDGTATLGALLAHPDLFERRISDYLF